MLGEGFTKSFVFECSGTGTAGLVGFSLGNCRLAFQRHQNSRQRMLQAQSGIGSELLTGSCFFLVCLLLGLGLLGTRPTPRRCLAALLRPCMELRNQRVKLQAGQSMTRCTVCKFQEIFWNSQVCPCDSQQVSFAACSRAWRSSGLMAFLREKHVKEALNARRLRQDTSS